MIIKIIKKLQGICVPAKISIMTAVLISSILMMTAFFIRINDNLSLGVVYMCEMMAQMASKIFSVGIFLGLCGDFLMSAVDRGGK